MGLLILAISHHKPCRPKGALNKADLKLVERLIMQMSNRELEPL